MSLTPVAIRGINVFPFQSAQELIDTVTERGAILVAVNAEKVMNATDMLRQLINDNIGYCDGAGAVKAMHRHRHPEAVRIPGCELWLQIIARHYLSKSFYLVGGKPGIVDEVVDKLKTEYPGINIVGHRDGYIADDKERDKLLDDIAAKKPDVVFVAMGSPKQEFLMQMMQKRNPGAIYQGLGGSFDVYSGHQQRAPRWWREHNLEFLYRFIITPSRLKRIGPYLAYALRLYTGRL